MASSRNQISLLLSSDRSEKERLLAEKLEGLGRTERQTYMRKLFLFAEQLYTDDPVLFDVVNALMAVDNDQDGFEKICEVVAKYRHKSSGEPKAPAEAKQTSGSVVIKDDTVPEQGRKVQTYLE